MKNQNSNETGARPLVVLGILGFLALVLALVLAAIWSPSDKPATKRVMSVTPMPQVLEVTPQVGVKWSVTTNVAADSSAVAPETEAALAAHGLSAKTLVPIGVKAQAVPPVIIGNSQTTQ